MKTPRAMILAAGFGTRLAPVSDHVPKPMLPVAGAPLVLWCLLWLRRHGIREIVVNLHHLGERIEDLLGDGGRYGVAVAYSREEGEILGTGGGLRKARPLLDQGDDTPIVAVNGKVILDLDLGRVLAEHRRRDAEATMVLRDDPDAERWGSLGLDGQGRVVAFLGKGLPGRRRQGPLRMFTGVQVFHPRFLDRVPEGGEACIVRTACRSLFDEGTGLYGFVHHGYWWEHSTVERYLQGVANVVSGRIRLAHAPHHPNGVDPSARVAASARIVPPSFVGPGAVVEEGAVVGPYAALEAGAVAAAGARIERSVVFPGARARGCLERAVVLEDPRSHRSIAVFARES